MKYVYFIYYVTPTGHGNLEARLEKKIESIQDVMRVARDIEKKAGLEENSVIISNFVLMSEE